MVYIDKTVISKLSKVANQLALSNIRNNAEWDKPPHIWKIKVDCIISHFSCLRDGPAHFSGIMSRRLDQQNVRMLALPEAPSSSRQSSNSPCHHRSGRSTTSRVLQKNAFTSGKFQQEKTNHVHSFLSGETRAS